MTTRWLGLLPLVFTLIGCASPHIRPDRHARKSFDSIDAIEFGDITLSDPDIIAQLKAIHGRSKWDPMPTTLPVDTVAIYGIDDGERRFKLVYGAGWLMDTDDEGKIVRLGTLNETDREWMEENIRSRLPPNPNIL